MKYLCILLLSVLSLNSSFANSEVIRNDKLEIYSETDEKLETTEATEITEITTESTTAPTRTCTISVYTELDNGTVIEGEVTIEGISLLECWGLHIYDWFSGDF